MAKHSKHRNRKRRNLFGFGGKRKRKNPFMRRRHSHRNPFGFQGKEILELGLGAAGGVVGSGYLSQMVLGGSNVGIMGYAADAVSTVVLAWLAKKFLGTGKISEGVLAGGFGALFKRIWVENISGASGSVSGLGNLEFAGLGYYKNTNFPLPTSSGNYVLSANAGGGAPVTAAGSSVPTAAPVAAPAAGGGGGRWGSGSSGGRW